MIPTCLLAILAMCGQPPPVSDPLTPLNPSEFGYEQARHLLYRAGFGGTPAEIQNLVDVGLVAAVAHLVDYESIEDPIPRHGLVARTPLDREALKHMTEENRLAHMSRWRQEDRHKFQSLRARWIERMLRTPRPLEEKMTLFWHGHFTSSYQGVRNAFAMAVQNDLLRAQATGNFGELLRRITRDPAMLQYLNNNQNHRRAPNENFARELLELFTLGEGNYTEQDVKDAARAFTGWTFRDSEYFFLARAHDYDPKSFLGRSGILDGGDIVSIVLEEEATARLIAKKLLTWLAVEPTAEQVTAYATLLRDGNYELKPFLRTLFSSSWFYSDAVRNTRIKSPVMLVVSFLRALGRTDIDGAVLVQHCDSIGQSLMQPPTVGGWQGGEAWITESTILQRSNITNNLLARLERRVPQPRPRGAAEEAGMTRAARGKGRAVRSSGEPVPDLRLPLGNLVRIADASTAESIVDLLVRRFLTMPLRRTDREALIDFLNGADGSPGYAPDRPWRAEVKLRQLVHLLTACAEFQLC